MTRGRDGWWTRIAAPDFRRAAGIAVLTLLPAGTVLAAPPDGTDGAADKAAVTEPAPGAPAKEEVRAAFEAMFRDPGNLDKTFRYAELAARSGDFEGAISALERMLLFNPNLPRVRLELGVLYFRLGSFEAARNYLQQALNTPNAPPEVRERVTSFLEEIDRRSSSWQFAGTATLGLRAQTNATAGPGSSDIRIGSLNLQDVPTGEGDANLFAAATLTSTYDFKVEPAVKLESTINLFATKQREQGQLDTRIAELRTGPRYTLDAEEGSEASLWPFLLAGHVGLGADTYFNYVGGGVNLRKTLTDRLGLDGDLTYRDRTYNDTGRRPDASTRDGGQATLSVTGRYALTDADLATLTLVEERENAEVEALSSWETGATLGYLHVYGAPFGLTENPWTSGLTGSLSHTRYDEPNPAFPGTDTREDWEYRLGFITSVPVAPAFAMVFNAQRTIVRSNLDLFSYEDSLVSVAGSWKF